MRAKEAGKPVVVSMGDVAGSGGYFVSAAADRIVAEPATVTGSIGVLNLKLLTSDLWEQLGVSWDEVHTSEHATMWTGTHDFTDSHWARLQAWLDRVYRDFTEKVARGRGLSVDRVLELAEGRIWSGADAQRMGLVDELGGVHTALAEVRTLLEIEAEAPVRLKLFPEPRTPLELLLRGDDSGGEARAALLLMERWGRAVEPLRPWIRTLRAQGVLRMSESATP